MGIKVRRTTNTTLSLNAIRPKSYELAVVILRGQPVHQGHIHLFETARKVAKRVLVLLGSAKRPRDPRNPFSIQERSILIERVTHRMLDDSEEIGFFDINSIEDYHSDAAWIEQVQRKIENCIARNKIQFSTSSKSKNKSIVLVGLDKDDTTDYMNWFPQWDKLDVDSAQVGINATMIRNAYFNPQTIEGREARSVRDRLDHEGVNTNLVPQETIDFLEDFWNSEEYRKVAEWTLSIEANKDKFGGFPYNKDTKGRGRPINVTCDAVVICNGHILLIERRATPGKGLVALPGGFLHPEEDVDTGCIRELKEETGIQVPKYELLERIQFMKPYTKPGRSLDGRRITFAHLIVLYYTGLPVVRGRDDARRAFWTPLSEFREMQEQMFEDHFHIGWELIEQIGKSK